MRKVKTFIENNQENLEKISLQAVNIILSYEGKQPKYIILDCDDTNVNAYGSQEGILFSRCVSPSDLMLTKSYVANLPLLINSGTAHDCTNTSNRSVNPLPFNRQGVAVSPRNLAFGNLSHISL